MKRVLLPSTAFLRSSRRFARKHPQLAPELQLTLELLAEDAFQPQLKTHKLKGKLAGSWACSGGYDLRVIFQFVKHKGADAVLLEGIGTHDEVY
ncbi:MAG: type II toxin-antitoxin system mRNA interferase toxin, RelE/StbE family [Verrucomicrobia bacterium]|nr:MAG: type II toxin-antitoxin system mRNA interferase toxin, RelE/StbE family [Verrucomicrobiota bacterium]